MNQALQNSQISGLLQDQLIAQIYRKDLDKLQLHPQKVEQNLQNSSNIRDNRLDKVKVRFIPPNFNKQILPPSILCFQIKTLPDTDCNVERDVMKNCQELSDKFKFVVDFISDLQEEKMSESQIVGEEPKVGQINKENQPKESKVDKDSKQNIEKQEKQEILKINEDDSNNSNKRNYFFSQKSEDNKRPLLYGQLNDEKEESQINRNGSLNSYFFKSANDNGQQEQAIPNFKNLFHPPKSEESKIKEDNDIIKDLALIKDNSYEQMKLSVLQTEEAVKLMQETGLSLEESIQFIQMHGSYDKALKHYMEQFDIIVQN